MPEEEVVHSSRRREEIIQYIIALPMMIPRLLVDAQTLQVLWASPQASQLLGYDDAEITQVNIKNILRLDEQEIQKITKHPLTQDISVQLKTGEPRIVRGVFVPYPDAQVHHFIFEDRTEWTLAYRFITETAPVLVRLPDEQFLPEVVCKVASLFQVKYVYIGKLVEAETVEGLALCVDGQIQPAGSYTLANTPCEEVFNRSTCFFASGARQLFPKDEELETLGVESYLGTPLIDSAGRPMGILWACDTRPMPNLPLFADLFRLIADQVSVVLERNRIRQELQQVNEQLTQAQKMESIGQMAGGLAHDFNNMLTAVLGFIELAQSALPEENSAQGYLQRAIQAVDKASQLTRQLLTFARRQPMQIQPIDLNALVQEALRVAQGWLPASIHLKVYTDQPTWIVEADPTQLSQVIYNLVINARDAMPQGGTLTVETANVHLDAEYARTHFGVLPGDYVLLAISDTGIGMPPEVKSRIFDPFYTSKPNASGLGLTIVYSIVRQLGGHIWVYSEPGRGTTFKIYLPRAQAQQRAEPLPQIPTQLEVHGQEVILLVEDEADVRAVASESLRRLGYRVLECASPTEALQVAEQHPETIHLLLTDVVMPVMSGKVLAEHIKRLHPQIKVLYVSGYTENVIAHHGVLDSGINFLPKPYTPSQLAQRVRQILDERGA
ncbi:MAG: ATP-binding protein [Fimbriimonadales bacterium]